MNNMKKTKNLIKQLTPIIFVFCLMGFLTGCGNDSSTNDSNGSNSSKIQQQTNSDAATAINQNSSEESNDTQQTDPNLFKVNEKMFIAQCNDIFQNFDDYKDKTICIEGICDQYDDPDTGVPSYGIMRKTPGCCGADGVIGFEFKYDGDMPKTNDWIEVTGKLEMVTDGVGEPYAIIRASQVKVLQTRGMEFVQS